MTGVMGCGGCCARCWPSDDTIILCGFFCILFFALLLILSNSVVTEQELAAGWAAASQAKEKRNGAIEVALSGAVLWLRSLTLSSMPALLSAARQASRDALTLPHGRFHFICGALFLPCMRMLPRGVAYFWRRLRSCSIRGRSDTQPAGTPRTRGNRMDWMYSVEQSSRILLNLQVGECWMNFGYWGPEVLPDGVSPSKRFAVRQATAQWDDPPSPGSNAGTLRPAAWAGIRSSWEPRQGGGGGGMQFAAACRALARLVGAEAKLCVRSATNRQLLLFHRP